METVARLSGLELSFVQDGSTTRVLTGLDLDIRRGEFLAILGASGVGKSTLLRVVADLLPPTAGKVEVLARAGAGRRATGFVFQDARLLPWRRVARNVALGLEGLGLSKADKNKRVMDALTLVGLAELADRWPHQLSGGQRQRVAIARAIAVQPDLLLMDEPFGALDAITRETLQDELLRIWRETGTTILFVTHDIEEAAYLADRVLVLRGKPARGAPVSIDLPRPRQRASVELTKVAAHIRHELERVGPATPDDFVI